VAHVLADECGAVEHLTGGARLIGLAHEHGRMRLDAFAAERDRLRHGVHAMPLSSMTLTQQTELGTTYALDDLRALAGAGHDAGLRVHLDGARLPNALVALGCTPADITWRSGVDVLSLGATKDGAIGADVIVTFDLALADELAYRQKRAGHLLSKQRFLSAQLLAWLDDDLWLSNAVHANAMAADIAGAVGSCATAGVELVLEPDGNEVFARLPDEVVVALHAAGAEFYEFDVDGELVWRFVTSWSTDPAEVATLRAHLTPHS
jgi:threonine aldolase